MSSMSPSSNPEPPRSDRAPARLPIARVGEVAPADTPPPQSPADAAKVLEVLRSASDQEFQIAERLASKARQGFGLAAAYFAISQTVAFGSFEADRVSAGNRTVIIALACAAVVTLFLAAVKMLSADGFFDSRDVPLGKLEDELNAAYRGDVDVVGRLGSLYLTIVRTRRDANRERREAAKWARAFAALALAVTSAELVCALIMRA